jgi:hypothetical protein
MLGGTPSKSKRLSEEKPLVQAIEQGSRETEFSKVPAYVLANEFVVMVTQSCIHTDNSHLLYQLAMSLVNKIGTESQLETTITRTPDV